MLMEQCVSADPTWDTALERDVFGLNRLGFPNRAHSDSPC
jgi:hypothetical protein